MQNDGTHQRFLRIKIELNVDYLAPPKKLASGTFSPFFLISHLCDR